MLPLLTCPEYCLLCFLELSTVCHFLFLGCAKLSLSWEYRGGAFPSTRLWCQESLIQEASESSLAATAAAAAVVCVDPLRLLGECTLYLQAEPCLNPAC